MTLTNLLSWTFGPDWPNNGEIDIIEGVNGQNANYMTVHTGSSCSVNDAGDGLLQPFSNDCDANDNSNQGCSFHDDDPNSYGSGFNGAGGGVFAMEWTANGVSIWRWAHGGQPGDAFGDSPNPSAWGKPSASWTSASCDFKSQLSQHNIIFDTTFCGSWAGAVYDGGLDACQSFVSNNPSAFANAYWGVNNLRVYQQSGAGNNDVSNPSASPSASPVAQASPSPSAVSSSSSVAIATSFSTAASSTTAGSTPTPASPNANATPTLDPLASNDFGQGSQGIPEGSEGWKRAADMKMGERRRRKHLARHLQIGKS